MRKAGKLYLLTGMLTWMLSPSSFLSFAQASEQNASFDSSDSISHQATVDSAIKDDEELPNFHEVHPYLYRGGQPTEKGLEKLHKMGVSTVIDLRAPSEMPIDESRLARKLGLHYINLVMDSHAPTEMQVKKLLHTIDSAKSKSEAGDKNSSVFVHCAHGSDRTGCMIGIWRVSRDGWDFPSTYKEMRKYYFGPKFTQLSGAVRHYSKENK